ncbi:hypothetical protein [Plantibacter sp. YIM 135249]|uniref:hypothetical protein n=1 Tax=Plantibacter sp. YIM 135249 TaxID=3423918 RepID=UPI003D356960
MARINPKVTASAAAAAGTTVLCWAVGLAGLDVPDYVQGAVTVLLVFAAGYATSDGKHAAD